jgi:hypothetical protein
MEVAYSAFRTCPPVLCICKRAGCSGAFGGRGGGLVPYEVGDRLREVLFNVACAVDGWVGEVLISAPAFAAVLRDQRLAATMAALTRWSWIVGEGMDWVAWSGGVLAGFNDEAAPLASCFVR